jgi:hypothetical protein
MIGLQELWVKTEPGDREQPLAYLGGGGGGSGVGLRCLWRWGVLSVQNEKKTLKVSLLFILTVPW